jgi:hypothetical protein
MIMTAEPQQAYEGVMDRFQYSHYNLSFTVSKGPNTEAHSNSMDTTMGVTYSI